MRVDFRQGIITYPDSSGIQQFLQTNANFVDLIVGTDAVDVTIAHRGTNYLLSETSNVTHAWGPFNNAVDYWLYWDINTVTGQRTFGHTELEPIYGAIKPSNPAEDQHWFDTTRQVMMVFKSGAFREYIRVFAAKFASASIFQSMGSGVDNFPFAGTQVALNVSNLSGYILFDSDSKPIIRSNKEFMTSETQFFISGSKVLATRLESNVTFIKSTEAIAKHHVVKVLDDDKFSVASYDDIETSVLGIITEDVVVDDVISVILQGTVVNSSWDFSPVGAKLWVKENGELSLTDPHLDDQNTYPEPRVPIARVLSSDTIIFEQGLGGTGKQGPPGIVSVPLATDSSEGAVFISVPPDSPTSPIAVGTNDPRMTDSRFPTPHNHVAENVTFVPTGNISNNTVQSAIAQLDESKLSIAGGLVTGDIQLNGPIEFPNSVVNKVYVDALEYTASDIVYTPTGNLTDTTTQGALDELENNKLNLSGGTLTGFVELSAEPVLDQHAATKVYVDTNIPSTTVEVLRFFMSGFIISSSVINSMIMTRETTLVQDLDDSIAVAGTAPTSNSFFDITVNGVTVGDIQFPASGTEGIFTFNTTQVLNAGDIVQILAPATVDLTLQDVTISISATVAI